MFDQIASSAKKEHYLAFFTSKFQKKYMKSALFNQAIF